MHWNLALNAGQQTQHVVKHCLLGHSAHFLVCPEFSSMPAKYCISLQDGQVFQELHSRAVRVLPFN